MSQSEGSADSANVNGEWARGQEIKRRRLAVGLKSLREFAEATTISRNAITAAEDGHGSRATYERLESWLDRFEETTGADEPPVPAIEQIEFVIEGRDVKVTVKAPITDPDALEEMVARIMRRIRDES